MHSAPAVVFPVGRSHFVGAIIGALVGCGALVMVAWWLALGVFSWQLAWALAWYTVVSLWLCWQWWHCPLGSLSWDGVVWSRTVGSQSEPVTPELIFDLQGAMLVHLNAASDQLGTWVWLDRAFCLPRWPALRRAIHGGAKIQSDLQVSLTLPHSGTTKVNR